MKLDSAFIKSTAKEFGFLSCGITSASFLENEAPRLESWLNKGYHGEMKWMENHFDKRLDPSLLVPGAKTVISLLYNYFPSAQQDEAVPKISKYAYGDDYHHVIKNKLKELLRLFEGKYGDFESRVFVDSAPLMERALAAKAGLGWVGKHSLLLTKQQGSFFFISQIVCDLDIEIDGPVTDHCGSCTACIDACPTQAIVEEKVVDAQKCIAYLTIELKEEIPKEFKNKMDDWVFGCDICQDVCPWNRFSKPHNEPAFEPKPDLLSFTKSELEEMTGSMFKNRFKHSAILRTGHKGFLRNLRFISTENGK